MVSAVRWDSIAAAIAAKFATVAGINSASSTALSSAGSTPSVVVMLPETIEITERTGMQERLSGDFLCDLLVARISDVGTAQAQVYTLIEAIRVEWWRTIKLGLDEVQDSAVTSFRLGQMEYAGQPYQGCRIIVHVIAKSTGSRSA